MTDHEQTLKPGSQLEEFRIEGVLGEGGFGITYLALDTHFQRHVAIKEYFYAPWCFRSEGNSINSRSNHKEDFKYGLDSFLQEARTIWKFKHPNIVKVIRFFEANGTAYIVMEYIEGQTLGSKIDEFKNESGLGMFNEKEMLFVLDPIINGLKKLHGANVYHRDLKPDNIMLRKKGSPVLIDFGAAREATGNKSQNLSMIVTEGYSPLEQYNSTSLQGPWTDIYALAAVAYTCLTGEKPDDATHRVLVDKVKPLVEAAKDQGSLNFLKAVDNALAIRPEDRPQTLEEWWEQLKQGEQEEVNEVKVTRGKDVYLKEIIEESLANLGCQRVITYQEKKFSVKIPAKSKSGTQLKLKGKGEQGKNGGENGDLYVEITVKKPQPVDGSDIYRVESVSAEIARTGGGIEIFDDDNEPYKYYSIPQNTSSGDKFTLSGKGKSGENGGLAGDLLLTIRVNKGGEYIDPENNGEASVENSLLWMLFSFQGRLSREGFWGFMIFFILIELWPLMYSYTGFQIEFIDRYLEWTYDNVDLFQFGAPIPWPALGLWPVVVCKNLEIRAHIGLCNILLVWPIFAVQVKRFHDIGFSGKKITLHFWPPFIGTIKPFIYNLFVTGKSGENKYGKIR